MVSLKRWHLSTSALLVAGLLSACGGGGGGGTDATPTTPIAAPAIATEGFDWINTRREQMGLTRLARNAALDTATAAHSNYLAVNGPDKDTQNRADLHKETLGKSGFTGENLGPRLTKAGYTLPQAGDFAYEVIASAGETSGSVLAEELITAIYHRFSIFEPMLKEAGAGASITRAGTTYFTNNLGAVNGRGAGLAAETGVAVFPSQTNVPPSFASDTEDPDPFPEAGVNLVGFPISVHANLSNALVVDLFEVRPQGGTDLNVRRLMPNTEHVPNSAAAIIPISPLAAKTTYEVRFSGKVNGNTFNKNWSFTTR